MSENCLTDEMIDNIYNEYSNVFAIEYIPAESDYYIGKILLKVNVEKDKGLLLNDYVSFKISKVKWKNEKICIVNPHWVRKYYHIQKLKVKVSVYKSKINPINNNREYYDDYEYMNLTYKQFIKRRLLEEYRLDEYAVMEAYANFQNRRPLVGYYQALNESSKHYRIPHDILKNEIIPKINNSIKNYKVEWTKLYNQKSQEDSILASIEKFIEKKEDCNVIDLFENETVI